MANGTQSDRGSFYDLAQIRQIPIIDICQNMLGLECISKGGKHWFKARPEKTASALLHEDKNTFHDFGGGGKHGDVIELVSYVTGADWKTAVDMLARTYHIPPIVQHRNGSEVFLWEYARIGLFGDLASKNFQFHADQMPVERIHELSEKYAIPMNELREKHPYIYERLLRQRALPYVRSLRNDYFLSLWSDYQFISKAGNPSLFFRPENLQLFDAQIKELQTAERILYRAVQGTGIHLQPFRTYDPVKDLEQLTTGEIKPAITPTTKHELETSANKEGTTVKYRVVDYDQYYQHMAEAEDALYYSAFLSAGRVVIGHLAKDYRKFKPYFERMQGISPPKERSAPSNVSPAHSSASRQKKDFVR